MITKPDSNVDGFHVRNAQSNLFNAFLVDDSTTGNLGTFQPDYDYWRYVQPNVETHFCYSAEDKFRKAFNIAKFLLEKKIIKLQDFINLVEELAKL
jgi:hypothetical protein